MINKCLYNYIIPSCCVLSLPSNLIPRRKSKKSGRNFRFRKCLTGRLINFPRFMDVETQACLGSHGSLAFVFKESGNCRKQTSAAEAGQFCSLCQKPQVPRNKNALPYQSWNFIILFSSPYASQLMKVILGKARLIWRFLFLIIYVAFTGTR